MRATAAALAAALLMPAPDALATSVTEPPALTQAGTANGSMTTERMGEIRSIYTFDSDTFQLTTDTFPTTRASGAFPIWDMDFDDARPTRLWYRYQVECSSLVASQSYVLTAKVVTHAASNAATILSEARSGVADGSGNVTFLVHGNTTLGPVAIPSSFNDPTYTEDAVEIYFQLTRSPASTPVLGSDPATCSFVDGGQFQFFTEDRAPLP